jgi:beta-lactamase regulating signal transducer with metallopeptidase domain
MAQLSYSFCMGMLHSLWQAGLLLLIYLFIGKVLSTKVSPLQKRNWLFVLLTAQVFFFIVTFFFYFLDIKNTVDQNLLQDTVSKVLPKGTLALITPWLFSIYIIAISYKMVKALYEWLHFKKLYTAGLQKPSVDLKLFTALRADHFGIKRKVQLWFSKTINAPVTFGFFKPIIVLPVALVNQLTMQQAEALILHELTHIKANDYLLNWALIIAEHIFFFNPFIISICKKIRLEREKYCDSNVIAFEYAPLLYAETLLKAQQVQQFVPQYQLAAVTGKKQLLQRIQFFTNKKNFTYSKGNKFIFLLVCAAFIVAFAATFIFQYKITATAPPVTKTVAPAYVAVPDENKLPGFVTTILDNLTDDNLEKIETAVEKQKPLIEKQLKNLKPLIKSVQEKAEAFAQEFDNNNIITPVAFKENNPANTKQVIVKEEQSGSKNAVVKVYTLKLVNGEWVVQPQWMLAAKEIPADSMQILIDTSIIDQQPQE